MPRTPKGYVFQRKDGRWVSEITIRGTRHTDYHATKKQADAKLKELRDEIKEKPKPVAKGDTVNAFVEKWLASASLEAMTREGYQSSLKRHVLPKIGSLRLAEVTPEQIAGLIADTKQAGESAALKVYVYTHRLFQVAADWQLISENPVDRIKRPKVETGEQIIWTPEQCKRFTQVMLEESDSKWNDLYVFCLYTGLRTSELLGLEWNDIRLAYDTFEVKRNLVELEGRVFKVQHLKSKAAKRTLPLQKAAAQALYLRGGYSGPVFRHEDGTPPTRSGLRSGLVWACKRADVPYIGMHRLRHQHCTMMAWAGITPKVAQYRMGHTTPHLTLAIYTHVWEGETQESAALLDEFMG